MGTAQVGLIQVGTDQDGTDQAGAAQVGLIQGGSDQAGISQVGTIQGGIAAEGLRSGLHDSGWRRSGRHRTSSTAQVGHH